MRRPPDLSITQKGDAMNKISLPPIPAARANFIQHAFAGRMDPEDMAYMGRAILQLADENQTLRAELRALQSRLDLIEGMVAP